MNRIIRSRYELVSRIGDGGYASVWKCYDYRNNVYYAIKIYSESVLEHEQAKLLEKKHKQFSHYNHPNIVPIINCFTESGYLHVVMPYYEKGALVTLGKTVKEQILWKICLDIADGLTFLHERNVVHLDVKPGNILQDDVGNFLLSDFCISQDIKELTHINVPAKTYGAVTYMAPERFFSWGSVSPASDIWALGATLYELATGEPPFGGLGGREQIQLKGTPLPPSIGSKYSQHMNDLIMACLRPGPQERPSAKDLVILSKDEMQSLSSMEGKGAVRQANEFYGKYGDIAICRLENYIIDKCNSTGLYGITDRTGQVLVDYAYDSISSFYETTWPGPGPLPPRDEFFLGAFFKQGDKVGYLCIHEDGSILEYKSCSQEEFTRRCQMT